MMTNHEGCACPDCGKRGQPDDVHTCSVQAPSDYRDEHIKWLSKSRDEWMKKSMEQEKMLEAMTQAQAQTAADEREACAEVAEAGFKYALDGYQIADEIRKRITDVVPLRADVVPAWIACSDRMPESPRKCVLVYTPANRCIYTCMFDAESWIKAGTASSRISFQDVTNWMPLPASPVEQGGPDDETR